MYTLTSQTRETGTAHKPLPKHPGNPPEPGTQVSKFNLSRRAHLSKAQQTAKLSCRRGTLGQLRGTAQQSLLRALQVRTVEWPTPSEDCFIQSLPLLGLAPTNTLDPTWKKQGALRKMKRREGEACWGKHIHTFQTSIFLNLKKTAGKIKFTGEQRELRPKMQSSSSNPQTSGLSHDSYTIQHPLYTTVKCRSTECFNELELVTSNCFSHFACGCSSDPSATALQKHTHTHKRTSSNIRDGQNK